MPTLAFQPNTDLSRGFTVAQVAEKHGWTEPMVWSLAPYSPLPTMCHQDQFRGCDEKISLYRFKGITKSCGAAWSSPSPPATGWAI